MNKKQLCSSINDYSTTTNTLRSQKGSPVVRFCEGCDGAYQLVQTGPSQYILILSQLDAKHDRFGRLQDQKGAKHLTATAA